MNKRDAEFVDTSRHCQARYLIPVVRIVQPTRLCSWLARRLTAFANCIFLLPFLLIFLSPLLGQVSITFLIELPSGRRCRQAGCLRAYSQRKSIFRHPAGFEGLPRWRTEFRSWRNTPGAVGFCGKRRDRRRIEPRKIRGERGS